MGGEATWEVVWNREERTLTLVGEPVAELVLSWPEIKGGGRGGKRIGRYYRRMMQTWKKRWERELYWEACLDLVACRERSRPFRPWRAVLEGEVTLQRDGLLSLRMEAREYWTDGRPLRVSVGDVWRMPEGTPVELKELFPGQRLWRRTVLRTLAETAQTCRSTGDCFLDRDVSRKLGSLLKSGGYCLREGGVEFRFAQCLAAPAAEGCPRLIFPTKIL